MLSEMMSYKKRKISQRSAVADQEQQQQRQRQQQLGGCTNDGNYATVAASSSSSSSLLPLPHPSNSGSISTKPLGPPRFLTSSHFGAGNTSQRITSSPLWAPITTSGGGTSSPSQSRLYNGLVLRLGDLKATELAHLQRSLTFYPPNLFDKSVPIEPILAYRIDATNVTVPRMFGMKMKLATSPQDDLSDGEPMKPSATCFAGELKPLQEDVVLAACSQLGSPPFGGIVSLPCGFGKTVIGIAVAARIGRRTLVIVHKEFLLQQWKDRIGAFLPDATLGTIQGKHEDKDCDVVLGMIQTIAARNYPVEFFDGFGTIILDEVHHFASRFFSLIFFHNRIRHVLGLSATPKRKDGLTSLLHHYVGDFAALVEENGGGGGDISRRCKVLRVDCRYQARRIDDPSLKPAAVQRIKGKLILDAPRNALILKLVATLAKSSRKQIVLSERVSHLESLAAAFAKSEPSCSCSLYIGATKPRDRPAAVEASVIFATFQMASEGLDVAALDTLVLASPYSDVTQSVGRILRPCAGKKAPLVVDIADDYCVPFERASAARASIYRRSGYDIKIADSATALEALVSSCTQDDDNTGTDADQGACSTGVVIDDV